MAAEAEAKPVRSPSVAEEEAKATRHFLRASRTAAVVYAIFVSNKLARAGNLNKVCIVTRAAARGSARGGAVRVSVRVRG